MRVGGGGGGAGGVSQVKIGPIFLRRRVGLSAVTYFVGCHILPWRVELSCLRTECRDEFFSASRKAKPKVRTRVDYAD